MRIQFISGMIGHPWGGSELLWSEAALRLNAMGHEVRASVARWPTTPAPVMRLRQNGVRVTERPLRTNSLIHRGFANLRRLVGGKHPESPEWRRIVDFRPDLVCISHGGVVCGLDWMLKCNTIGLPYVSLSQANSEHWWSSDSALEHIRTGHFGAVRSFFVSDANRRLFELQIGARISNGEVVWNPYNVPWDFSSGWPDSSGTCKLACVARLEPPAKGQDLLFQVLAMDKWRQRDITVSLYGKGPNGAALQALSASLGIENKVVFAGHVSDVGEIWRTHHALVLPSRYEGLPLSLVEAMLCGRPSIVTDVAGNAEPLDNDVSGFIAEAPTVKHLNEAMERAWQRRNEWESIGQAAATAIRGMIPQDPAQAFADKLLGLIR